MFGGRVSEQHRAHVTDWWVEVMGGPAVYTERHGGGEHMLARHHDLGITPEQRLMFVTLLTEPRMTPDSRTIRSSAPRSWATRSGGRA